MYTIRVRDIILIVTALVCCVAWWSHDYSLQYKEIFKIVIYNAVDQPLTGKRTYVMPEPLLVTIPGTYSHNAQEQQGHTSVEQRLLLMASAPNVLEIYDLNLLVSLELGSNHFRSSYSNTRRATKSKSKATTQQALRYRLHFTNTIIATIADVERMDYSTTTIKSEVYVLTSDYTLHAYTLTPEPILRWQTRVLDINAHDFEPTHAGLQVMHRGIHETDNGAILVAVEVNNDGISVDPNNVFYAALHSSDGALRWCVQSNASNPINDVLHQKDNDGIGENEFDFDGQIIKDFNMHDVVHGANDNIHEEMFNEKNSKGEVAERKPEINDGLRYAQHWTHFRTSVLQTLPHFYTHLWDEHVELQHFAHYTNNAHTEYNIHRQEMQTNDNNDDELKEAKEQKKETPIDSPNVLVYHGAHGIEVLHLYTGYILTRVEPLKPYYVYYQNINNDNWIDGLTIKCTWPEKDDESIHYKRIEDLIIEQCTAVGFTGVPDNEVEVLHVSIDEPSESAFSLKSIHKSLSEYQQYLYRSDDKYTNVRANVLPHIMRINVNDRTTFVNDRGSFIAQSIITVKTFAQSTPPNWLYRYVPEFAVSSESVYDNAIRKWTRELIVVMSESGLLTCVNVADNEVMWQTRTAGPLLQKVIWAWSAQEKEKHILHNRKEEMNMNTNDRSESLQHSLPYVHLTPFSVLLLDTLHKEVQDLYLQSGAKHSAEKLRETKAVEEKYNVQKGLLKDDYDHSRHYGNAHLFRRERFRYHDYVLAVRDRYLTFVNVHSGNVISSLELSEVPVAPLLVADLDGDGISDLLVVTDMYVLGLCGRIEPTSTCMRYSMFIVLFSLIVLVLMWEYRRQRQSMHERLHSAKIFAKPKHTTSVQHLDLSKQVHEEGDLFN